MLFSPATEGTVAVGVAGEVLLRAFARRVVTGLLSSASAARNQYEVEHAAPQVLRFRAVNWLTASNVGLNDVELTLPEANIVRYRIRYARWTCAAVAIGATVGFALIALLLLFDLRGYIAANPGPEYLGLSPDQNVAIAWSMALFWGFAYPWILVAMHKKPLRRLMDSLIAEVDVTARHSS